jgi:hypothetical protein
MIGTEESRNTDLSLRSSAISLVYHIILTCVRTCMCGLFVCAVAANNDVANVPL